jgi:hypothetical protein
MVAEISQTYALHFLMNCCIFMSCNLMTYELTVLSTLGTLSPVNSFSLSLYCIRFIGKNKLTSAYAQFFG